LSCANPDTADVDFIAQFPGQNRAGQIGDTSTGAAGSSLLAGASIMMTARELGVDKNTLRRKINRLEIKVM